LYRLIINRIDLMVMNKILVSFLILTSFTVCSLNTYKYKGKFYLAGELFKNEKKTLKNWLFHNQIEDVGFVKQLKKVSNDKVTYELTNMLGDYLLTNLVFQSPNAKENFNCFGFVLDHLSFNPRLEYVSSTDFDSYLKSNCSSSNFAINGNIGVVVKGDKIIHAFLVISKDIFLHKEGMDFEDHIGFVRRRKLLLSYGKQAKLNYYSCSYNYSFAKNR